MDGFTLYCSNHAKVFLKIIVRVRNNLWSNSSPFKKHLLSANARHGANASQHRFSFSLSIQIAYHHLFIASKDTFS